LRAVDRDRVLRRHRSTGTWQSTALTMPFVNRQTGPVSRGGRRARRHVAVATRGLPRRAATARLAARSLCSAVTSTDRTGRAGPAAGSDWISQVRLRTSVGRSESRAQSTEICVLRSAMEMSQSARSGGRQPAGGGGSSLCRSTSAEEHEPPRRCGRRQNLHLGSTSRERCSRGREGTAYRKGGAGDGAVARTWKGAMRQSRSSGPESKGGRTRHCARIPSTDQPKPDPLLGRSRRHSRSDLAGSAGVRHDEWRSSETARELEQRWTPNSACRRPA